MPRYMSIHKAPGLSGGAFEGGGFGTIAESKYATHVVTYLNFSDGVIVNIYDADSEDALEDELDRLGWPYESINTVDMEATAEDFRKMGEE